MSGETRTLHDRGGAPELSAVLVSPGGLEGALPAFYEVVDQTAADRIELLLTTPDPKSFQVPGEDCKRLHSLRVVDARDFASRGEAAAPGVLAARAPVVALVENHVYLDRRWAEIVLDAHRGPSTGVTVRLGIANPDRFWARVSSFMDYGDWIGRRGSGETTALPWHNSSYKREALAAFGDEIFQLLEPECLLQERLKDEGHRFFVDDRASIGHLASSTARSALLSALGYGREFAITRRGEWSIGRRLLYAVAWPVFPFIRAFKLRSQFKQYGRVYPVVPLMPGIFSLLVATSFGECLGYLGGMGRSRAFLLSHDLHLEDRIHKREHKAILNTVRERQGKTSQEALPPAGKANARESRHARDSAGQPRNGESAS